MARTTEMDGGDMIDVQITERMEVTSFELEFEEADVREMIRMWCNKHMPGNGEPFRIDHIRMKEWGIDCTVVFPDGEEAIELAKRAQEDKR